MDPKVVIPAAGAVGAAIAKGPALVEVLARAARAVLAAVFGV